MNDNQFAALWQVLQDINGNLKSISDKLKVPDTTSGDGEASITYWVEDIAHTLKSIEQEL